jgi:hypothetical protein
MLLILLSEPGESVQTPSLAAEKQQRLVLLD